MAAAWLLHAHDKSFQGGVSLTKFARVVNEYVLANQNDDALAHKIMEQQGIEYDELSSFAAYLQAEFESSELGSYYQEKIEELQYVVNEIFMANQEGYTVQFPTCYIRRA